MQVFQQSQCTKLSNMYDPDKGVFPVIRSAVVHKGQYHIVTDKFCVLPVSHLEASQSKLTIHIDKAREPYSDLTNFATNHQFMAISVNNVEVQYDNGNVLYYDKTLHSKSSTSTHIGSIHFSRYRLANVPNIIRCGHNGRG